MPLPPTPLWGLRVTEVTVERTRTSNAERQASYRRRKTGLGWTWDVWDVIDSVNLREFSIDEIYKHEDHLAKLHPQNKHVRAQIQLQLQILRDLGFIEFVDNRGHYRWPRRGRSLRNMVNRLYRLSRIFSVVGRGTDNVCECGCAEGIPLTCICECHGIDF